MTPKQIRFINEINDQISDNLQLLETTHFGLVHELSNKSVATKLTKAEEEAVSRCAEELKIERWYMA